VRDVHLDRLTSPEVGAALREGWDTVVVACGATEQHGPHLSLSMDASHGTALATAVARRLGRSLVAPTIRVGCSEHHMAFPGTLTLRPATLLAVLEDYVDSLARHGFRRIVVVPTHGGNFGPLAEGLPRLREVAGGRARVEAFVDLQAVMEVWTAVAEAEGGLGAGVGGHADVAEGSILLALHPEAVRPDRVEPGRVGPLDAEVTARLFAEGMAAISPNGVLGDPTGMNAELGRRLVDALADRVVEALSAP
jgi:creatinine amidohydrolase